MLYYYAFVMLALKFRLPSRWPIYLLSALIALLAVVTVVGERGVVHLWRLRGEKIRLDERNYLLQAENEALRRRIARLRNDDRYLEKLAREELNMVRPGDVVYRFPPGQARDATRTKVSDGDPRSPRSSAQKPLR